MKIDFRGWMLLLAFGSLLMPGRAQTATSAVIAPGVFTYTAPPGWTVVFSHPPAFNVAKGPMQNGFAPTIVVVVQPDPKPLAAYVELNKKQIQARLKNVKILDEQPFVSASHLPGTRLTVTATVDKTDEQQTYYFFTAPGGIKMVATCSALIADGKALAPLFDASMKTFALY